MANHMEVTVKGHLGADPVRHTASSGTVVAALRVAHSVYRRTNDSFDTETQWFDVKCFGDLAHNVCDSLRKGSPVLLRGRIVTEHWQNKEGEPRSKVAIIASSIGVELSNGSATYTKNVRDSSLAEQVERHREPWGAEGQNSVAGRSSQAEPEPPSSKTGEGLAHEDAEEKELQNV